MKYYVAIDGGGTKTHGILADENNKILSELSVGATNPNDVGVETSVMRLTGLVSKLAEGVTPDVICAGVAGAGNHRKELEKGLASAFPMSRVKIVNDVALTIAAELPGGDGCCLICGTGCVCFARKAGELHRIGGWGWLIDGGGSGYNIGRDGLEAVFAAYDGRRTDTMITDFVYEKIGKSIPEALTDIYDGGKPYIASFAPCVIAADIEGDMAAGEIIERNMSCLAEYLNAASYLFCGHEFEAVLAGGILINNPSCVETLKRVCRSEAIPVSFRLAEKDPVFGALAIAVKE